MIKKIIASVLIPTFLLQVVGCYSENFINKESLNKYKYEDIGIITNEGKEYEGEFDNWFVKNDTLVIGFKNPQKIPLTSIEEIYKNQFDVEKTILLLASLVAIPILLLLILQNENTFGPRF